MPILPKPDLRHSNVFDTDSYKLSHWTQYPPGMTKMMSYFESRGGEFESCTLFGLQYVLHRYLSKPVVHADVDEMAAFADAHGVPFNREGWDYIVRELCGRMPVRIRAIPEGTVVPTGLPILTIESTDENVPWIVSWLETALVRLWEPCTVAIASRESKQILADYLAWTADDPESIDFKLHDFGSRGVTSQEQARLAGAAHLLSFQGSDTIEGIRMANHYYNSAMAGFSIPATEHSTVTMWGREHEYEMFGAYVKSALTNREVLEGLPKLAACVSDSFDIYEACRRWTSDPLKSAIRDSGGTLVIRPDSGNPLQVLPAVFEVLEEGLGDEVTKNSKGFKVLPPYLRVIQGDGININSMTIILDKLHILGWSASNIAFGSGGGLLQRWNRDTQKWAFKCCAAQINGEWVDVRKNPITDPGKQSKAGRLDLVRADNGDYKTALLGPWELKKPGSVMETVFENGDILVDTTFAECRQRMVL